MMISKLSRKVAMMAVLAILYVTGAVAAQQLRHELLEDKDLTDLLDADLDEPFRQQAPRRLQEVATASPTPSPTAADGERGVEVTFSPTPATSVSPTPVMDDLITEAPVTSGASSWRSSASVSSALVFVGSVATAALMA